jgi:peptidoglycan hydrolase-like protein with peptidoglycan-binding domain
MMIDAFDTAEGVRYNEFSTTGAGEGLAFVGRTRPLSLLNLKPAVPTLQMTSPYTIGLTVGVLQADLNRNGAKLTIDSIFGPKTRAAVQNFQRTHGLVVDGIVGPLTWAKLS